MAVNFDDFVEQVREANPIEEVLEESGFHLRGHGRLRTSTKHDSMKVRTDMGRVWWYSQNWNGDVFGWVMREKNMDFNEALEVLARRAHIEMPKFSNVNESEVRRVRATADAFSVAATVFHRWLMGDEGKGVKADEDALDYVRGRGWSDETIRAEMVGFSGRKSEWQVKDMIGDFSLYGINPLSPAAVAVLGFEGDVEKWAREQGVLEHPDFDPEWINWKRIYGLMDKPGVIYCHRHRGGVNYLSRRNLPGFDTLKDKNTGKVSDHKSDNPKKALVGEKKPYFNAAHLRTEPIVLVEGQGDAITWGQWGQGAMAFCGLLGNSEDVDAGRISRLQEELSGVLGYLRKHPSIFLALDEDAAGQAAIKVTARLLGPKVQIVRMPRHFTRDDAVAVSTEQAQTSEGNEANNGEG